MAQVKTDPTPIDDAASKTPSNWLSILRDVFPRWHDRLRSSKDAGQKLANLLCDPETRSKIYRVNASGEEISHARRFGDAEFWSGRLLLVPDDDGGDDHLEVNYGDALLEFHDPGGHWEFDVRRRDVERWEGLDPELAAPPSTAAAPAVSEVVTQDVSPGAQGVNPFNTGAGGHPSASQTASDEQQDERLVRPTPSTPGALLPPSHKPTTPSKKRKRPTMHDRLISLMKDLKLKPGMLPHEVLRAVKQPYKDKYHDEPSQSAVTRAYDEYEGALTNSGNDLRGMPADLSKLYPATPTYEWLNLAVD
jgi:hypothetical protein